MVWVGSLARSPGGVGRTALVVAASAWLAGVTASIAEADSFDRYELTGSFELPAGSSGMDVLPGGRLVAVSGNEVFVETGVGTRLFNSLGSLPGADISPYGVSFFTVSPSGTQLAVGNNGGASGADYFIGVFDLPALTGRWLAAAHFDGTWYDEAHLALASGDFSNGAISMLTTTSVDPMAPENVVVVDGIGGASGGVAFDGHGYLYAGNGFMGSGPSGTGAVKAFAPSSWQPALSGGEPVDFESSGTLLVDILSAASLGFDPEGNLHVSGADYSVSKFDFAALVHHDRVVAALSGGPAADVNDTTQVRRFDPDAGNHFNFYSVKASAVTRELYIRSFGEPTVYVYEDPAAPIPASSEWGLATGLLLALIAGTVTFRRLAIDEPHPAGAPIGPWC